jgi:hypothetical protein
MMQRTLGFHGLAEALSGTLFEKSVRLIVREQRFNCFLELWITGRRASNKRGASLNGGLFQSLQKDFAFPSHSKIPALCWRNGRKIQAEPANILTFFRESNDVARLAASTTPAQKSTAPNGAQHDRYRFFCGCKYLLHDPDGNSALGLMPSWSPPLLLPPRSPNLNAYLEQWHRSVKEQCLSKMILFGEASLRHVLSNYGVHFHTERNHQGKGNVILFPEPSDRIGESCGEIRTRERLGGLLKFYYKCCAQHYTTEKPHEPFDPTPPALGLEPVEIGRCNL